MQKFIYKKLSKDFSPKKLKEFFDEVSPGKTFQQCKNIIKQSTIIGVFDKNKLVGIGRSLDDTVYAFITDILISPVYRGKGIGSEITKEICADLKKKKIRIIHCSTSKNLVNFYKSAADFKYDVDDVTLFIKN
jgi:ribosomal protein S18 acetylase RimI-like enzyme